MGGGNFPRTGPRASLPGSAPTVPLPGAAAAVGGGYASAKSVLVCGSCGLMMHRLVYKLASEPGPRPRLSAKRVSMYGNATSAVLGSARDRGMAGGLSGNATPAGLGRARNRGVAGGVNGDATPAGLGKARNRGGGGVNGNATPVELGTARNRGVAGGVNLNATPARLGKARNRGVARGVSGNATQAGLGMARGGRGASPGRFVKVINEVTKGLEQVAAYLNDVIVFDSDPSTQVKNIRALFERLRKQNLKLSPSKTRLDATDADFLDHSISPAGVRPNAEKVSALTLMPMPRDLKQLRFLLGGLSYYRKCLLDMSKRIRPITALLKKGVKFSFTPSMEVIVRDMLAELAVFVESKPGCPDHLAV